MVKILEKEVEENPEDVKCKDLFDLTQRLCNEDKVVSFESAILDRETEFPRCWFIDVGKNQGIFVYPALNQVCVRDQAHYEEALQLAEAYEQNQGEEFTLQKEY